jgi:AcrR family transcriptional regulator
MKPQRPQRPYHQQVRKINADMTRMVLVRAAIDLLGSANAAKFSMDAVASLAGASRMTVFNLFGDKRTLLVAVYDALSQAGQLHDVADILNDPDIDAAWGYYVQRFALFYQANSLALRHLRGMAALDADFDAVMRERDARRDLGIAWLLQRQHGRNPTQPASQQVVAITQQISALMGFEVLDALTHGTDAVHALALWQGMVDAVRGQAI